MNMVTEKSYFSTPTEKIATIPFHLHRFPQGMKMRRPGNLFTPLPSLLLGMWLMSSLQLFGVAFGGGPGPATKLTHEPRCRYQGQMLDLYTYMRRTCSDCYKYMPARIFRDKWRQVSTSGHHQENPNGTMQVGNNQRYMYMHAINMKNVYLIACLQIKTLKLHIKTAININECFLV